MTAIDFTQSIPGVDNEHGQEFEQFESLGQSDNSTAVLQDKINVTTAMKPAGDYEITFSCDVCGSTGGNTFKVEFSVDDVSISQHMNGADLYVMEQKNNNDWQSLGAVHPLTLSSPRVIDLAIKHAIESTTISRISNAIIKIIKVSN